MKKIFLFVLCSFCFVCNVSAKVYYSDYGEFSDWSNNYIDTSDTIYVEKERRFNFYHLNKEGDYYLEGENDSKYPIIDKEKSIKSNISEWSFDKPQEQNNRIINTRRVYEYEAVLPIRYIYISNIKGGKDSLGISEIKVKNCDTEIKYAIECNNCTDNFNDYITNGVIYENKSRVMNNGSIIIDLNYYYNYSDISILLYLFDEVNSGKEINVSFLREKNNPPYLDVRTCMLFISESLNDVQILTYNYSNMKLGQIEYDHPKISEELITSNREMKVKERIQYNYYDIKYYYYKEDREYNDQYSDYYNNIDNDKYIDYYRYKKRDMFELSDDNQILDLSETGQKFVLNSTVPVKIEGNIDINTNGKYMIKYITPFITVEKTIEVNIPEETRKLEKNKKDILDKIANLELLLKQTNNVNNYNSLIEDINNYKVEVNKLNIEIEDYKNKLKIKENEKNIIDKEMNNKLFNTKLDYENELNKLKGNKKEVNTSYPLLNIKFKPILLLFLPFVLIIILFSFKKIKKKN